MGGADDANVDPPRPWRADRLHLARLEGAQELYLKGQGQIADLVEEERAALRRSQGADRALHGAGEGPALVAEQLRLGHLGGDRAAVDGHEGAGGSRRQLVDGARGDLLAGAALTVDEHGKARGRRPLEEIERSAQGRITRDDSGQEHPVRGVLALDPQHLVADPHQRPGADLRLRHPGPVDHRAVGRPEILDPEPSVAAVQAAVVPGDEAVRDVHVVPGVRPERDEVAVEPQPALGSVGALPAQFQRLGRRRVRMPGDRRDALRVFDDVQRSRFGDRFGHGGLREGSSGEDGSRRSASSRDQDD